MYKVKFYKGNYAARQRKANNDNAVAYIEHHFNSSSSSTASYAVVVTGSNASRTSKNWGRWYAKAVARFFGTQVSGDDGILVGGWNGRGDGNLKHTNMPAILLEPLFASNPQHAEIIRSTSGQDALARILTESIQRFFPAGGLIAFSVGHKYKKSNPDDRGAALAGGGTEADYAEKVLKKAAAMLQEIDEIGTERTIRVMQGDQLLFETPVDEDTLVVWDPDRGLLSIPES
ncbi:MAG: N-acetylmuramoyl-L-alanine amidase [Gammaproteobacteria bacterium]|nr:N-acetylmuramoyl-L-alanine amidase [Gammaproteobacteria bacterium]